MVYLNSTIAVIFVGSAQVDINELLFAYDSPYDIDNDKILRLKKLIFEQCSRLNDNHHIPALISPTALEKAMALSDLHSSSLAPRTAVCFPYLKIDGSGLQCLRGKHRLLAAKDVLPWEDKWWIVDLYTQEDKLENTKVRSLRCSNENYNHGELYRTIRHYTEENLDALAEYWKMKLSCHSRKNLRRILSRESWKIAFDNILRIPGLRKGMSLSSMHHIMNTHCDEEILRYLHHIKDIWYFLVDQSTSALERIDEQSVEALEFSAPRASLEDVSWLDREIDAGRIFTAFTYQERKEIFGRLRQVRGLVPGLISFYSNMKYIAMVSQSLVPLLPSKPSGESIVLMLRKMFLHQTCRNQDLPISDLVMPEGSKNYHFDTAYRSLVVWAMRNYACVPLEPVENRDDRERKYRSRASIHADKLYELAVLAQNLGFVSARINSILSVGKETCEDDYVSKRPPELVTRGRGIPRDRRRSGLPTVSEQCRDRPFLTLEYLHTPSEEVGEGITSFFVRKDVYLSFFGHDNIGD